MLKIDGLSNDKGQIKMWPSRKYVDLKNPIPDMISDKDIAHHLSLANRYGGGTPQPYSVAEHSISVANCLLRETGDYKLAWGGLFHDSPEAYLGDIIGPLKYMLPEFYNFELVFEEVIEDKFKVPRGTLNQPEIKQADREILAWEMAMIRDNPARIAPKPEDIRKLFLELHLEWLKKGFRE